MENIILHSTPMRDFKFMIGEVVREQLETLIPKKEPQEHFYLTRSEAAAKLRITLSTLDKYSKAGIVQSYKVGGRIRFKSSDIEKAFEAVKNQKYRR
jgi:excisionase family DNA binding protein